MRRMDKYKDQNAPQKKRSDVHKDLYQDLVNNPKYTDISSITNSNAFEIDSPEELPESSRERYQQMKRYNMEVEPKAKKELDDFKFLYQTKERKIYDINSVLEEARKNRQEKDELEEKRKLKYTSYNILAGVNLEELAKYREEKKQREMTPEEEGIRSLMDTIATKTLAGELDKDTTVDILSDLMATSALDKVAPCEEIEKTEPAPEEGIQEKEEEPPKEEVVEASIESEEKVEEEPVVEEKLSAEEVENIEKKEYDNTSSQKIDRDFYTKSMDLSAEDFEMSDDFAEKGLSSPVKVLLALVILVVIIVAVYFIVQKF